MFAHMSTNQVKALGDADMPNMLKATFIKQRANDEILERQRKHTRNKVEKMFDFPLMVSICMLAMAHGSNEINVAAPLLAEIFLLDSGDT